MVTVAHETLKGYCPPNLKLAHFVCYLKIENTFSIKYGIEILVG